MALGHKPTEDDSWHHEHHYLGYRMQCERVLSSGSRCQATWKVHCHNGNRRYCPPCAAAVKRLQDRERQRQLAYVAVERRRTARYAQRLRQLIERAKGSDPSLTDAEILAKWRDGDYEWLEEFAGIGMDDIPDPYDGTRLPAAAVPRRRDPLQALGETR
jgi:hypothetical protein